MSRLVVPAVVAVLLLSACGGGGGDSSPPAAGSGPPVVAGDARCPDPGRPATAVVDHGADTLPAGATAARLCSLDDHGAWVAPRGVLTTGLDRLVAVVDGQRVHDPLSTLGCGGVGGEAWAIVLRYPGGTRTVTGDNGGCWDLRVGGSERFGSRRVFAAYLHALVRQRHRQGSPDVVLRPPPCPRRIRTDGPYSPVADATRLAAATLCRAAGGHVRSRRLTAAQVALVRHDVATARGPRDGSDLGRPCLASQPRPATEVAGVDVWGDPVTLLVLCDRYRTIRPASDRYLFVRMLPATAALLAGRTG